MKSNCKKIRVLIYLVVVMLTLTAIISENSFTFDYQRNSDKMEEDLKIKTASDNGTIAYEWFQTFDTSGSYDRAFDLVVDSDENIYVTGTGIHYIGAEYQEYDYILIKYDKQGVMQWSHVWGGWPTKTGRDLVLDSSENIFLIGSGYYDPYSHQGILMKYNDQGIQEWNRTWGGTLPDHFHRGAIDSSDNIYVTGRTRSYGTTDPNKSDMCLVKYNHSGDEQWYRTWGGTGNDGGYAIEIDSSENVYVGGYTASTGAGGNDFLLVKYNPSGIQLWNRTWGYNMSDVCSYLAIDSYDNIYLAGSNDISGNIQGALVKYNSLGNLIWNVTWGGLDSDGFTSISIDSSNNLYIGGTTHSYGNGGGDVLLAYFNNSGDLEWFKTWGGDYSEICQGINQVSPEIIYLAGETYSFGVGTPSTSNLLLIKADISSPQITINSPYENELFGIKAPFYNISISEQNLSKSWYTLDNGINNITINQLSGFIDQKEWNKRSNGTVNIVFYANDTAGNIGSKEVVVRKDMIEPLVTILDPKMNQEFGEDSLGFNISIDEPSGVDSMWYTIDGGSSNHTFTELIGVIDENVWLAAPSGPIIIRFYAKDLASNIGYSDVVVIKNATQMLYVDILQFSFSVEYFNVTFLIYNENEYGIDFAMIQMEWNSTDVSTDVQNLGEGVYFVSLIPITVLPGEEPILLNMTISADGYQDKYFETYLAVDPDTLNKDGEKPAINFPFIIIIVVSSIAGGIGIAGITVGLLRKKKRTLLNN